MPVSFSKDIRPCFGKSRTITSGGRTDIRGEWMIQLVDTLRTRGAFFQGANFRAPCQDDTRMSQNQ
jgi:hypothetical protein